VYKANAVFVRFSVRFSRELARIGLGNGLGLVRLCALTIAVASIVTSGCATPVAILNISAPSTAIAASPFTITITATVNGRQDTIINSEIHVTSSDPAALVPTYYQFTAADAGSHTFPNGVTLMTPGSQTITATVITLPHITGSITVTVSAASAATRSNVSAPPHRMAAEL
jgi:hypothetical protein